jgi:hypothetical protein
MCWLWLADSRTIFFASFFAESPNGPPFSELHV